MPATLSLNFSTSMQSSALTQKMPEAAARNLPERKAWLSSTYPWIPTKMSLIRFFADTKILSGEMVRSVSWRVSFGSPDTLGGEPELGWPGGLGSSGLRDTDRLRVPDIVAC
ncbi:unnamed protein product, partial [Ixodes persulcatus]